MTSYSVVNGAGSKRAYLAIEDSSPRYTLSWGGANGSVYLTIIIDSDDTTSTVEDTESVLTAGAEAIGALTGVTSASVTLEKFDEAESTVYEG